MLISADVEIPFPRSLVFATYRDRFVELLPYLPDIQRVEPKSRYQENGRICCVNDWQGGGDIPVAVRAFLSEDMLSWTERNIWDEANFTLEWRIEPHAYTDAVACYGVNRFIEANGKTIIQNRGQLSINPNQIQNVPKFLRGGVASLVEEFLGKKIQPNLVHMGDGVRQYLDQHAHEMYSQTTEAGR